MGVCLCNRTTPNDLELNNDRNNEISKINI